MTCNTLLSRELIPMAPMSDFKNGRLTSAGCLVMNGHIAQLMALEMYGFYLVWT